MAKRGIVLLMLILLSVNVFAQGCSELDEGACNGQAGCVGKYRHRDHTSGPWVFDRCIRCAPEGIRSYMACRDYIVQAQCDNDPCDAIPGGDVCAWHPTGYCYNPCDHDDEDECIEHGCYPTYGLLWSVDGCFECDIDTKCSDYGTQNACNADPCRVAGVCAWDEGVLIDECIPDMDGDGIPEAVDNCPNSFNPDQENIYCTKHCESLSGDEKGKCCRKDPGDACGDVDADGIIDKYEDKNGDGRYVKEGSDPDDPSDDETDALDSDSNDNCISDGVERGFDPIIDLLKKIAVGLATAMIAYQGLRWVTSESPEERNNAKQGVVYILIRILLMIGGKDVAVYIFYMNCAGESPPVGYVCKCTPPRGEGGGGGSCPFVYSYDGERFHYEHESFPFAALKAFEYETYGNLRYLKEVEGSYTLKVSEERDEVSYINGIGLYVVDYVGNAIMPDTHGGIHTVGESIKPLKCVDKDGNDCLTKIVEDDDIFWASNLTDKNLSLEDNFKDYILLEFENIGVDKVKILIMVESTTLLEEWDIALDDIGKNNIGLAEWMLASPVIGGRWKEKVFSEAMLHIQLWDGTKWIEQDQLGVGREGGVQFLVVVNTADITAENLKIRLIAPAGTYEINSVYADFTSDGRIVVENLLPYYAIDSKDDDILEKIFDKNDNMYAIIHNGEYATLKYRSIPRKIGYSRGYVVGMKGYFYLNRVENISTFDTVKNMPKYLRMLFEEDYGSRHITPQYV